MKITTALENINLIYYTEELKEAATLKTPLSAKSPTELVAGWEVIYTCDSREGKFWTAVWTIGGFFSREYGLGEQLKCRIQESLQEINHFRSHNDLSGKSYRELKRTKELLSVSDGIDIHKMGMMEGAYFKFARIAISDIQDAIDHLQSIKAQAETNVEPLAVQEELFRQAVGSRASAIWENKTLHHLNHNVSFAKALPQNLSYRIDTPYIDSYWVGPSHADGKNEPIAAIKSISSIIEFAYAIEPSLSAAELKERLADMLKINSIQDEYKRSVEIISHVFDFIQSRRALQNTHTIPDVTVLERLVSANDNLRALDPRFPVHKIISYMDSIFGFSIPEKAEDHEFLEPQSTQLNYDFWQWYHRIPDPKIAPSLNLEWCRKLSGLLKQKVYVDKMVLQGLLTKHELMIQDPMSLKSLFLLNQSNDKECALGDFSCSEEESNLITKIVEGGTFAVQDEGTLYPHMMFLKELKADGYKAFENFIPFDLVFVQIALKVLKPHTKKEAKEICEAFLSADPSEDQVQGYLVQMMSLKLKAKLDQELTKAAFNTFMTAEVNRGDLLIHAFDSVIPFPRSIRWNEINF